MQEDITVTARTHLVAASLASSREAWRLIADRLQWLSPGGLVRLHTVIGEAVPLTLRALTLGWMFLSSTAWADTQATYRCDNGKQFTITFTQTNNFCCARLKFADTPRALEMENQNSGSGSTYVGGSWQFHEWHGEASLTNIAARVRKEIPCHATGGR